MVDQVGRSAISCSYQPEEGAPFNRVGRPGPNLLTPVELNHDLRSGYWGRHCDRFTESGVLVITLCVSRAATPARQRVAFHTTNIIHFDCEVKRLVTVCKGVRIIDVIRIISLGILLIIVITGRR